MEENHDGISRFSALPELCISHIMSLTSPKDACRAAAVSKVVNSASKSDLVWQQFLPSDYVEIISTSLTPVNYSTKKELFIRLADSPILLNGGKLSFWLSKHSGKKCFMLCAKDLSISWNHTPVQWDWISIPESRFSEVANLEEMCWLDIEGRIQTRLLSRKTNYAVYLVFKIEGRSYGIDFVSMASVRFANSNANDVESARVYLSRITDTRELRSNRWNWVTDHLTVRGHPNKRLDGWMEMYLGEFFNNEEDDEIEMKLYDTDLINSNMVPIIEGIELRPKEDA